MEWPTRLLEEVGVRVWLRVYWGGWSGDDAPPDGCKGTRNCHNAMSAPIFDHMELVDVRPALGIDGAARGVDAWNAIGGTVGDYADDRWPVACDACGEPVPPMPAPIPCDCGVPGCTKLARGAPQRQLFRERLYRAPDGTLRDGRHLEVGDMYFSTWKHCNDADPTVCSFDGWTNCDGRHLHVCTPNPHGDSVVEWDTDSRANNCGLRDDMLHRCWVRTGVPGVDPVHISKDGLTCNAGAGSIQTSVWHGVLVHGVLKQC